LRNSDKLSKESAKPITQAFDDRCDHLRRQAEALAADAENLRAMDAVAQKGKGSSCPPTKSWARTLVAFAIINPKFSYTGATKFKA